MGSERGRFARRLRQLFLGLLVLGFLAAVAGGWWLWSALWGTRSLQPVVVEIPAGLSSTAILEQFRGHGLLPSVLAGRVYLEVAGRERFLHRGTYRFEAGSRPVDVLEQALDGEVQTLRVTIVEGSSLDEIRTALLAAGLSPSVDWDGFVSSNEAIRDLAPRAVSLEGFLFPDTYFFSDGVDVVTAAHHMVERFRRVWGEAAGGAGGPEADPFDTVILASLVEAETGVSQERARIAGVFSNRLERGMLLQCDPTVVFALKRRGEWTGRLLRAHWATDDPYNTYRYPGLPPGPINNPGRAAIAAALAPERHTYLYFVADPHGGHSFSKTLREHNLAVARLRRSRH